MQNKITEESILAKYNANKQQNESAFLALGRRKKEYEEMENTLAELEKRHLEYIDKYREAYAGTHELVELNMFDQDIYDIEEKSRKIMLREKEAIYEEEKRLNTQQDEIERQFRSELNNYREKRGAGI